jgi:hypothetical protein
MREESRKKRLLKDSYGYRFFREKKNGKEKLWALGNQNSIIS